MRNILGRPGGAHGRDEERERKRRHDRFETVDEIVVRHAFSPMPSRMRRRRETGKSYAKA